MGNKKTLQKILKLKDNRKKEIEIEVKKAADKADEEKAKLSVLEQDYQNTFRYFSDNHEDGSMDIGNLIAYQDFFSRINGKINEQQEVHTECRKDLECLKDSLVHAHKEKKVFELMKDKAVRKENKEKSEKEQKENDFFALSRRQG